MKLFKIKCKQYYMLFCVHKRCLKITRFERFFPFQICIKKLRVLIKYLSVYDTFIEFLIAQVHNTHNIIIQMHVHNAYYRTDYLLVPKKFYIYE